MVAIKSRLESPELTTRLPQPARQRLTQCLAADPGHITPGEQGDHVKAIQDALTTIAGLRPDLALPAITDKVGTYGDSTVAAVMQYKAKNNIVRPGQPLDDIVGRMTISQIDNDLLTKPKPAPAPVPPPVAGIAGVQVAEVGRQRSLIVDYYKFCGLETIGPGQISTSDTRIYSTLEGLIDTLIRRDEMHQVIVNHGESIFGLLIQICPETVFKDTGAVIGQLSALADIAEKGPIDPSKFPASSLLRDCQNVMQVRQPVVLRLVAKLVALRKKQFILHFRACNMPDEFVMNDYKRAFGARMITYHECRLLFQRMTPVAFASGHSSAEFPLSNNTARDRARVFEDPIGLLPNLVIAARDLDGHTKVTNFSFVEPPFNEDAILGWAEFLLRRWQVTKPTSFVVPMMWKNAGETIFHCPLEIGWALKLKFV
jgi:peptidoglycan hydrolase-like protein with peptidoglycan-binding domain